MRPLVIALVSLLLSFSPAFSKEIALIIGIDDYAELPSLNKAVEDANGYRDLFRDKGYDVYYLENPTSAEMRVGLAQFYDLIEPEDSVVFIYSGHGWSDGTLNYLVPADTPDVSSTLIAAELSVPVKNGVNGILDRISAQGAGLTVAVIDACRNNPFSGAETRALGVIGGLAPVEAPSGTFIVYSAASNQTALDRLGENDTQKYSVFTRFFLPNLRDLGDLRTAIVETRGQVRAAASIIGHRQRPAYYDELTGSSCLFGDCGVVATPVLASIEGQAEATWSIIQNSKDPQILRAFVGRFEESDPEYAVLARSILQTIPSAPANTTLERQIEPQEAQQKSNMPPDSFDPATLAQLEAIRRIAILEGTSLDLSGITELVTLPAELSTLVDLERLDIGQTNISDLSLAYALPKLREPNIAGTPLSALRITAEENLTQAEKYQFGEGVEPDIDTALSFYLLAYDQYNWNGYAAYQIGYIYDAGEGIEEDPEKAFDYMSVVVERGRDGEAADYLAEFYEYGIGTRVDYAKAAQLILLSLTRGSDQSIERIDWADGFEPEVVDGLQLGLRELGLYSGSIDGNLGPQTIAAMQALCDC